MKLHLFCELDYSAAAAVTFLLNIRPQENERQKIEQELFSVVPQMPHRLHVDPMTGNRFDQITAELPGIYHIRYEATVETSASKLSASEVPEIAIDQFRADILSYLYPSRYCQSDRLGNFAAQQFGDLKTPPALFRAVS